MRSQVELQKDVLLVKLVGYIDNEEALGIEIAIRKVFQREQRPLIVFIDLRDAEDIDTRARRVLADTIKVDGPMVIRTAVLYSDRRLGAKAKILYRMGERDVQYFTDKDKALAWLKEWNKVDL
jgi:hypothetical protein